MPEAEQTHPEVGIRPPGFRMPASARPGPVRLQVRDADRSLDFYEKVLGLQRDTAGAASLRLRAGDSGATLIELVERPGARPVPPRGRLGLYHVAYLLPDRGALGRFIRHATSMGMRLGMADHLVSEAVYLSDPDGLGIEVCADRPRSAWRRNGAEYAMATDPLDVADLLRAAGNEPWTGSPEATVVGHVHLHVGDLAVASRFYHEALGLDQIVWSYPGALFLSAGAYHHHLGTNTWAHGAPIPTEDDARLLDWSLQVPAEDDLAALSESFIAGGFPPSVDGRQLVVSDPWGASLRVYAPNEHAGPTAASS